MYKIVTKETLVPTIHLMNVEAPEVAKKGRAGQFVIVRAGDKGERIPLTIADWDEKAGTVTIVFQEAGKSTKQLATMNAGEFITDFVGPLGLATDAERFGTVVCVGGGVGVAPITPIARTIKQAGNRVISILGARNRNLLFWEDRLRSVSDELIVTTDDGSYGRKGVVTEPLKEILANNKVDRVIAVGPVVMMKFCSLTTKPFGVKTIVSLNAVMLDGTGMCGCCRVSAGGQTKFACVDGPDFDGHTIDWDLFQARQMMYANEEKRAVELWQSCKCGQTAGKGGN